MSKGMEHRGECIHRRLTEEVIDMIGEACIILDVEMELLQVGGPLLMAVILETLHSGEASRWCRDVGMVLLASPKGLTNYVEIRLFSLPLSTMK
jgi:hypothetical protein